MDVLDEMCNQIAVYWAPGAETQSGQVVYTVQPVEIACRWEDTASVFIDRQGDEATSKAEVFVREKVSELGVLWLSNYSIEDPPGCALQSLATCSQNNPFLNPNAYEIRRVEIVPTVDDEDREICCYLGMGK